MFFLDSFLKGIKPRFDDDLTDRVNYYYTPMLLVIFSLTMSAKQYVGQPIQCWVPAQFTGAWEQYTENYCFVQNTYFLPLDDVIPKSYAERDAREIGYYQWVPFVLALQALLFFLPNMVWRTLNWQSGINVKAIVRMAINTENVKTEDRDKNVKVCAAHIQDCLILQRDLKSRGRLCGILFYGKYYGCYVTALYLFIKVLFLGNVICNNHRHTVQCVLMINMFNEKIFLFLWWWFILVAVMDCCNILIWIYNALGSSENTFVSRYLRVSEDLRRDDRTAVSRFIRHCLRPDGVLILRLVAANAGDIVATDLIHSLWMQYKERNPIPPPPMLTGTPEKGGSFGGDDMTDPGFTEGHYPPEHRPPPQAPPIPAKPL